MEEMGASAEEEAPEGSLLPPHKMAMEEMAALAAAAAREEAFNLAMQAREEMAASAAAAAGVAREEMAVSAQEMAVESSMERIFSWSREEKLR